MGMVHLVLLTPTCTAEEDDEEEPTRNWRPPGVLANGKRVDPNKDYAALAGKAERECMELLGFPMTLPGESEPIKVGKGIEPNGFIKDRRVLRMWGVTSYTSGVWGYDKMGWENKAIQNARNVSSEKIKQAVAKLRDVEMNRKKDMRGGQCSCAGSYPFCKTCSHKHQLEEISDTREALEHMLPA